MPVVLQVSCYKNTNYITRMYTEFSVNNILNNSHISVIRDARFSKDDGRKQSLKNTFKPKREWSNKFKEIPAANLKIISPISQESDVNKLFENKVSEKKEKKCNCDDYNNYQTGKYQITRPAPAYTKIDDLAFEMKPVNLSLKEDQLPKSHSQVIIDRLHFDYRAPFLKSAGTVSNNYEYGYKSYGSDILNNDWTKSNVETNPYSAHSAYVTAHNFNKYYAGKSIYKAKTLETIDNTKINSETNVPRVRKVDGDTGEIEVLKSVFEHEKTPSGNAYGAEFLSDIKSTNPFTKRKPGRPKGAIKRPKVVRRKKVPEFLRDLLLNPVYCPSIIMWEDYAKGKFRFTRSEEVAKLWGKRNGNADMSFDKFSRAMRYYYHKDILVSVPETKLVYKFGPKGPDYDTDNPNFELYKWGNS